MNIPKRIRRIPLLLAGLIGLTPVCALLLHHQTQEILGLPAVRKGEAPLNPAVSALHFPQPQITTLPNGLRVFVIEDHRLPYVQCSLSLPAGSLMEPKRGLADLTASMMMEGTEQRTESQLAMAMEQRGMSLHVRAEAETTDFHCGGAAADFPQLLAFLREVLLKPAFPKERLLRLQSLQSENWQRTHSNTGYVADQVSGRLFYRDTPYAQQAASLAEIQTITGADLVRFYGHCYRPNGAVLGVMGDVRAPAVLKQLQTAFDAWKEAPGPLGLPPARGFPAVPATHSLHLVDWRAAADTALVFEARTVARTDPDYVPLVVANRVLGGVSSSRLFQNLRETQGYTYGVYSTMTASSWPGTWSAWMTVPYAQTGSAVRGVYGELQAMADIPVPAEELSRAKRGLIGSLALSLEQPGDVLSEELDLIRNGLPADYWQAYSAQIQAVTSDDVQRVVRRYLWNGIQVIVIGPHGKIVADLRPLGSVHELDHHGDPVR